MRLRLMELEAMWWLPYMWTAKLVKAHAEFIEDLLIGVEV